MQMRLMMLALIALMTAGITVADDAPEIRILPQTKRSPRKKSAGKKRERPPLSKEAQQAAEKLQKTLAPNSEARLMFDAIMSGSNMGPNAGWFGVSKAKSRFDWKHVAATYDRDTDSKVTPKEFGGNKRDFGRMDRNGDGLLTQDDFGESENSLAMTPGSMLFRKADKDGNGRISKEEFAALFDAFDSGFQGYLSMDDLKNGLQLRSGNRSRGGGGGPSRSTLILSLANQELGALTEGPGINETAPDFTLTTVDGLKKITLSKELGDQPVVLIFGSFT